MALEIILAVADVAIPFPANLILPLLSLRNSHYLEDVLSQFEYLYASGSDGAQFNFQWNIDPSGYVYDSETNEKIEGATVTAYWIPSDYSSSFFDEKPKNSEYGTIWNAEEWDQVNPLVSDASGYYSWNVPEGWWRVKCEKEGYESVWSEWMPVPPPQTDVNIGMKSVYAPFSFSASLISPQQQNTTITLTAGGGNKYKFYYESGGTWKRLQDVSSKNTCEWKPAAAGTYTLYVDIMDSSGKVLDCRKMTYVITQAVSPELKVTLSPQIASPITAGTTITLTANATGGTGSCQYKFYCECNGTWTRLRDFNTQNTYNWQTTNAGIYTVYCDVKDSSGKVVCATLKYKIVKNTEFVIENGVLVKYNGNGGNVVIPDSVTEIGDYAFYGCASLTGITMPKAVTKIGVSSFENCNSLSSISVPASVTEIGYGAFSNCSALKDVFFAKDAKLKSFGTNSSGNNVYGVFHQCTAIKTIVLPDTLTAIPDYTFSGCTGLASVTVGNGVTSIGQNAFEKCSSLKNAVLPKAVTTVSKNAFIGCSVIKTVRYTGAESGWNNLKKNGINATGNDPLLNATRIIYNYSNSFTTLQQSPQVANTTIVLKATGGDKYKFYYECSGTWKRLQDVSTSAQYSWKPTVAGRYNLYVDIIDESGCLIECLIMRYDITSASSALTATMTAQYAAPQTAGTTIKLTVNATGGSGSYQYKFYSECNGVWTKLWDYDTKNTYNWHATTVGTHTVYCDVKDSSGKVVCSSFKYQIVKGADFVADLNANRISGQYTGTEIRLLAGSSNGTGTVKYKFYYELDGNWVKLKDYSTQDYFLWTPTKAGFYNVYVDAKDSSGNTASKRLCITIESGTALKIKSLTANPSAPTKGNPVTLTGTTTGGESPVTYKFYYELNGSWVKIQDFGSSNKATFTPSKAGTYHIYMDAIDGKKNTQCLMITVTVR